MSDNINNILELGANIGLNASALKVLYPEAHYTASRLTRPHFRFYRQIRMWMLLTIVPYMNLWISRGSSLFLLRAF